MQNPPTKSRVKLGFYLSIISLFASLIPLLGYPISIIAIILSITINGYPSSNDKEPYFHPNHLYTAISGSSKTYI